MKNEKYFVISQLPSRQICVRWGENLEALMPNGKGDLFIEGWKGEFVKTSPGNSNYFLKRLCGIQHEEISMEEQYVVYSLEMIPLICRLFYANSLTRNLRE